MLVDQLLIDVCSILGSLLDSLQCRGREERRGGEEDERLEVGKTR